MQQNQTTGESAHINTRVVVETTRLYIRRDEDAPAKIPDPDATKPDDWHDDEPEYIADPDAVKPDDW